MSARPCKRPKVEVIAHPSGVAGAYQTVCLVPGCGTGVFNSVKTACEEQATRHRGEHRDAVPSTRIDRDPLFDVYCTPCGGHLRTFPKRTEAQTWLDAHLTNVHGLVTCP